VPFGRKRGAQPKNNNARKHGFYAAALAKNQQNILRRASRIAPHQLEQDIALLRARVYQLVTAEPDNLQLFVLAMGQLTRMVAVNHGLTKRQEDGIHDSLKQLIQELAPLAGGI
jgi:inorganic triphosphatase YgiF